MNGRRLESGISRYIKVAIVILFLSTIFTGTLTGCDKPVDTINFSATLDGQPWTGPVDYKVEKKNPDSVFYEGESVEGQTIVPMGTYAIAYISGGPPGTVFQDMTHVSFYHETGAYSAPDLIPGNTHALNVVYNPRNEADKYTHYYTFNFISASVSVKAKLDGGDWSGPVAYSIEGPGSVSGAEVPRIHSKLTEGQYTLTYNSGGPDGAVLKDITPDNIILAAGQSSAFTLNFVTPEAPPPAPPSPPAPNELKVLATLDGKPWSGPVVYTIGGPEYLSGDKVIQLFTGLAEGRYSLSYVSGGPENAILSGISPPGVDMDAAGGAAFTLEFISAGTIIVKGYVSKFEWSGPCDYTLTGPVTVTGDTLQQIFTDVPLGEYTIEYIYGGPPDTYYYPLEPETKTLNMAGDTLYFNMNFVPRWYQPQVPLVVAPVGADLSLTAAASDYTPGSSDYYFYYVTVTNSGPQAATGVQVRFQLGAITCFGQTPDQGTYNEGTGIWDIGDIAPGASVQLALFVGISGAYDHGDVVTLTAEIIASGTDDPDSIPNNGDPTEDDQDSVTITVTDI